MDMQVEAERRKSAQVLKSRGDIQSLGETDICFDMIYLNL
jgi:hypothetical protein